MPRMSVSLNVDEAVGVLKDAFDQIPLKLVAHINGQANAAKLGIAVTADQILEEFRPDLAARVWQAHRPAGIDIPLRFHVYEDDGRTWIRFRTPSEVFARHRAPALDRLAQELDPLFARALAALNPYRESL